MKAPITYIDGEFANSIDISNRGFFYGDGLFETIRLHKGKLPLWSFHRDRLDDGLKKLSIYVDLEKLDFQLQEFIRVLGENSIRCGGIKIVVTRDMGGRGSYPANVSQGSVFFLFRDLPPATNAIGVTLVESDHRLSLNRSLAGVKHLSRLEYIVAANGTPLNNTQELLLLDQNENVIETMHHNIFAVIDGVLVTPVIEFSGVSGVMRRTVMDVIAPYYNWVVQERKLNLSDLMGASEVFISNALCGVIPVAKICTSKVGELAYYSEKLVFSRIHNKLNKEYFCDED